MRTVITVPRDRTLILNLGSKNNDTKIRLTVESCVIFELF